jgi:hypothetical protein
MKKIFLFLLLVVTKGFSQIDSTALSFYPLTTGNYWEYKETLFEYPYIFGEHYFYVQVTGDTLLTNGKTYKIIKKEYLDSLYIDYYYERVDSITGNVFRYNDRYPFYNHDEYLIDSLKAAIGDTYFSERLFHGIDRSQTILDREDVDDLFNQKLLVRTFYGITWVPGYKYQLAQMIGLIRFIAWGESRSTEIALQYANIDGTEYGKQVEVGITTPPQRPTTFKLYQNYPNPFNPTTAISYQLSTDRVVDVSIYNMLGQKVATLVSEKQPAGTYNVSWNASDFTSGVYFCRLTTNETTLTKKMLLVR